ncbi:MAG: hypothetical protein EHM58_04210 [Ignavibacteriae bacterium]|nr:MAG: hypothetical protein EHM58_04210 [Ignavibacteriota bacterium]
MQGCFREGISIFSGDFESQKELMDFITFQSCLESSSPGEKLTTESTYEIGHCVITFTTQLEYYIAMGNMDNRFIKTEIKKDKYEYKNGAFIHIKDKDNVNWDDSRLEF